MSSPKSEIQDFDVLSDFELIDSPRYSDPDDVLEFTSDRTDEQRDLGSEAGHDDHPEPPSEPCASSPLSREVDLMCRGVEIVGINSEHLDSVASGSRLNVSEESHWEGAIEGAVGGTEQEEPLQDPNQEFSSSFSAEGLGLNPNLDSDPGFVIQGDYVDPDESFAPDEQQILWHANTRRGNLPASAKVVENLPLVTVGEEGLGTGDGVCAICKDKFVEGEKVKVLPCEHRYHQDCILPWLWMHNTCPVCRLQLPRNKSKLRNRRSARGGGINLGGLRSDAPV